MNVFTNIFGEPLNTGGGIPVELMDRSYINELGDSMKGELSLGDNKITDLANPSHAGDAATKEYVDNREAQIKQYVDTALKRFGQRESFCFLPIKIPKLNSGGFRITASSENDSTNLLFDDSRSTYWGSSKGTEAWIMIECPYTMELTELTISHRFNNFNFYPNIIRIVQKSQDGVEFTDVHVLTNASYIQSLRKPGVNYTHMQSNDGAEITMNFSNVELKYLRYYMKNTQDTHFGIYKFKGKGVRKLSIVHSNK